MPTFPFIDSLRNLRLVVIPFQLLFEALCACITNKTYCEGGSAVTPHAPCVCCLSKSSFCCLASFAFDSSRSSL
ncbi:hypothetical protein PR003_g30057 [Phytophthora rubi]|uniref:Secreted protein n=1 Tax=Phytophthora rubi TaxID=129364 RepID=A0A6A4BH76_9STRA|nr:hypothetical protein PR002_g30570 [Phytophthora rubi]KAE8962408.1 hypothetical protein PR001_g29715 [Phytophthora rubi]KAE9272922.1 hypothetical protein PR003_g30057 [Phytophthora rubi]